MSLHIIEAKLNDVVKLFIIGSFYDSVTNKNYKCRVAFQVLIHPDSYEVAKETIGYGEKVIDEEFKNTEIEWSTKQYGATVLYGLLIKAEEEQGKQCNVM